MKLEDMSIEELRELAKRQEVELSNVREGYASAPVAATDIHLGALRTIASQSLAPDWTADQAIAFVKQHAKEALSAPQQHAQAASSPEIPDSSYAQAAHPAISKAFVTLESTEGRYSIVMKFNQKEDAFAAHSYLLGVGGKDYRGAPVAAAVQGDAAQLAQQLREYASNPGYSHNDYADTMRQAADALAQRAASVEAKPIGYAPDYLLPRLEAGDTGVMCTITAKPLPGHGVTTAIYAAPPAPHVKRDAGVAQKIDSALENLVQAWQPQIASAQVVQARKTAKATVFSAINAAMAAHQGEKDKPT